MVLIPYSLIQIVFVPIIASIAVLLLGRTLKHRVGWLSFASLVYVLGLLIIETLNLYGTGYVLKESYKWATLIGDVTFVLDGLNSLVALTIVLLATVISVYSIKYMENEDNIEVYNSLYLIYVAGMVGTVLSTNLAIFFLFFELMLIPSWILVGVWGTGDRMKVAFKYFMYTEFGAIILLAGIGSIYTITGTFDIYKIGSVNDLIPLTYLVPIALMILVGLFVKMAIFPLHTWLPDTHAEAPTPISALLSPAMIGIGGYATIRIIYTAFPAIAFSQSFMYPLLLLSVITIVYGGMMAFAQDDMKRLLAYSSISQMGYMLFGIASVSIIGVTGAIIIYISHALSKAALFMISGVFSHDLKTRKISELRGLASRMPIITVCALLGFLGISGVPPLIGFWGEIFIFIGAFYKSLAPYDLIMLATVIAGVLLSILTAGYGLWTVRRVFYGELPEKYSQAHDPNWKMLFPIVLLVVLAVVIGIYPNPIIDLISAIVKGFFG